jgi:hypothetical protein
MDEMLDAKQAELHTTCGLEHQLPERGQWLKWRICCFQRLLKFWRGDWPVQSYNTQVMGSERLNSGLI